MQIQGRLQYGFVPHIWISAQGMNSSYPLGSLMCAPILQLDEDFNLLCCLYVTLFSGTRCDERVLLRYLLTDVPTVDNLLE